MRLPDSFLEELRARTPLAALIGRRVKLSRSGRQWKGCCPFHGEKTPSFYVYDDGYHCFGCGAHGDAIGFVMQSQGASFMEAVEALAGEAGLDVPKPSEAAAAAERVRLDLHGILQAASELYQRQLFAPQGAAGLAYLRGRGLSDATIKRWGLGWSGEGRGGLAQALAGAEVTPARLMEAGLLRPGEDGAPRGELFYNRVMFPIRDRRGRVISFGGRMLGDGQPKYVNGPETPVFSKRRALFGLDFARDAVRNKTPVVAVEGYMDVIALHQAGFGGAVAPLGTALTEEQLELLWQLSPEPTLCFDGDAAGARAAVRAIELAFPLLTSERTLGVITLPSGEDPDSILRSADQSVIGQFRQALAAPRPIEEAYYDRLLEGVPRNDTRLRAQTAKRLFAAASSVPDRDMGKELRIYFTNRLYPRDYKRGAREPVRRAPRPVPAESTATAERIRMLTAILLRHPQLLPRLEEAYAILPLPPRAQRLHTALQAYVDDAEHLDSNGLIAHLTSLRLADDCAWALGEAPLPLPACAGADATAGEAEAGWWAIYGLMRRGSLEAEVDAARRDFAAQPSAALQQRLVALCAALESSRRGDHGADAANDD